MKNKLKNLDPIWKSYAAAGSFCIILFCFLMNMGKVFAWIGSFLQIFSSIFVGAVIAFVLNPMAVSIQSKLFKKAKNEKLAWALSVVLTVIVLLAFITLLALLIVPQLIENIESLLANLDVYVQNLDKISDGLREPYKGIFDSLIDGLVGEGGILSTLGTSLLENIEPLLNKTVGVGKNAISFIISFVLALYFLLAKTGIRNTASTFFNITLSPARYYRMRFLLHKLDDIFSKYIFFQLIDSLIIGTCNYVFMTLTGMPDAIIISVLNAVTNLIPTFGPLIGAAVGAVLLLMTKPAAVVPFLIFTLILQTCDGYVIKPKLFGNALNVPGVIILAAVIVLGKQMGAAGALLAIPIAAVLVFLYDELLLPWLQLKKEMKAYSKENGNTEETTEE